MTDSRSFLDNLKNLRLVMSVALEYVRKSRDQFVKDVAENQVSEFEMSVSQIRMLAEQLEMELSSLEYLIAKRPSDS
jgi:hypothetical protein